MTEVTWSFPPLLLSHTNTPTSSTVHAAALLLFLLLLFSKCLERARQDTVAALKILPLKKNKNKKNLRHHARVSCLATSATAFTFLFFFSASLTPLFSFLLYYGVCRGISTPLPCPGGQWPTESVSLQVKNFFCVSFSFASKPNFFFFLALIKVCSFG